MKKIKLAVYMIAFGVLFTSCELQVKPEKTGKPDKLEASNVTPDGAGTNFVTPNIFDAEGNLCIGHGENDQTVGTPMQLWMGVGNETAGKLVGYVNFEWKDDQGYVVINLTDTDGDDRPDYFPLIVETVHIHFAETLEGIPTTPKGNPIPGQFEYNEDIAPDAMEIRIAVDFEAYGAIHIAATSLGGIEGFNYLLPDWEVDLTTGSGPTAGGNSYWTFHVGNAGFISEYDGAGLGEGVYEGWCVDNDLTIGTNTTYPARLYSSYEDLTDLVDFILIGDFDKINYIVNNYATGDMIQPLNEDCSLADGRDMEALTYGDIQLAIWHFVNGDYNGGSIGAKSWERVWAIICDTNDNGEGFVPGCDEKIVFIVVPYIEGKRTYQLIVGQPIIGELPVSCETESGTAWGDGYYGAGFPGAKQWGTYFTYGGVDCDITTPN